MDESSKDKEQLSDSELYDVTVRRDDTESLDDMAARQAIVDEEVEKTTPEGSIEAAPAPQSDVEEVAPEEPTQDKPVEAVAIPVAAPSVTPAVQPPAPVAEVGQSHNSGGVLVLQWLSYAFWGWFGFSMAILSGITIGYFMDGKAADFLGGTLAYPLAAVIVMLVIALVTDFFYARHEPAVKTGAANVIMLIHVVFDLLITVGAFITIVFAAISMMLADTNVYSDGHNGQKIAMLTAVVVALIFGSLSFRALFGGRKANVRKLFWLLMSILALVAIVGSIAGPAAKLASTKTDRLIEDALPTVATEISDYVRTNDRLPASLSDVKSTSYDATTSESVQQLISKNLVTYKPNTKPATTDTNSYTSMYGTTSGSAQNKSVGVSSPAPQQFYYQLCVTYKEEKNPGYYSQSSAYSAADYTDSTITTYSHPKGEKCYDLQANGKYSYNY